MNQDYKEAICKASDTIGFLVRELQDVHSNAPNVGTEMIVLDWLRCKRICNYPPEKLPANSARQSWA